MDFCLGGLEFNLDINNYRYNLDNPTLCKSVQVPYDSYPGSFSLILPAFILAKSH
jgi:hypothetical protein